MTLTAPLRCTAVAEQLDEPMIGTIDQRVRWLLVEDHAPWGQEAVREVLGPDLAAELKAARVRALLIRRREGDPAADATRRAILVDTATRQMAVRTIQSVRELDAAEIVATQIDGWGAALVEPMVLVCSNGKRDACCAVRGRLVLAALANRHASRTWECSHLGGHRFAANVVCLPHGIVYGRATPATAPVLVDGYIGGQVEPEALRGRSAWPQPAQVAEHAIRVETGIRDVDAITLLSTELDGGSRATVRLGVAGTERTVELVAEPMPPPRPISCRADELEEPVHWRVLR